MRLARSTDREAVVAVAVTLTALIFVLRQTVTDANEAITNFYSVPIAMIAVRFGTRGGVLAASLSVGLVAIWANTHHHIDIGPVGYVTRATAFLVLGVLVGRFAAERSALVKKLTELARTDTLTGLPNRAHFDTALAAALGSGRREDSGALLLADLDGFKAINDTWGHERGDDVLKEVAAAMRATLQASDLVARLGGDEFAMLLPDTTPADAEAVAARVKAAVGRVGHGRAFDLGVSVGVAFFRPGSPATAAEVLRAADEAMYTAKRASQQVTRDAFEPNAERLHAAPRNRPLRPRPLTLGSTSPRSSTAA